ncbi:MAG TPA: SDR family oxidoreductase [Candidatus Binatia bacterium]|nr:SDR family oxidoreductase [Candidatus Binatia bacterium]
MNSDIMNDLEGRTAILTGASGGLGLYIAQALASQKMNLVVSALLGSGLDEIVAKLSDQTRIISVPADVMDKTALESLVLKASRTFGAIDVLINNVGIAMFFPYHRLRAEDIERAINVNLTSTLLLTWMVLPGMLERRCGHIVNISSLSAKGGPPCAELYAATKAGLIAFTESLRAEYCGTGVSASAICPGFVEAGIYQRAVEDTGLIAPRLMGTSSPEAVAYSVIQAIKKDIPEIVVNPGPTRLLTTAAELSPSFAEWVMRHFGINRWFKKVAEVRERKGTPNR